MSKMISIKPYKNREKNKEYRKTFMSLKEMEKSMMPENQYKVVKLDEERKLLVNLSVDNVVQEQ